MSKYYSRSELQALANVPDIEARPNRAERTFGLHPALFVATIGAYVAFIGVMASTFTSPELILPFAICIVYIAMAFGTPALWGRVAGRPIGRYQTWAEFRDEGMEIETGHIGSGAAIAQVLVLPILIVGWAVAMAVIVAAL